MIFVREILFSVACLVVLPSLVQGQELQDPFYRYGFPQDEIFIDIDKAGKNSKEAHKLKVHDVDLSLELKKLEKFKYLKVLELKNNKLDSLPIDLFENRGLQYFSCAGNSLKKIPEALANFEKLQELKLINTRLDSFPSSFRQLFFLRNLELQSNVADTFHVNDCFSNLKSLERMLVYRTVLDSFPKSLNGSKKLKELYLVHTNVGNIDSGLYQCKKLEVLVLEGNGIKQLDKRILNLKNLKVLSFKNNQLKVLPEYLSKLPQLKTLDLLGNPIPRYQVEILRILLPKCRILF